MMEAAVKTVLSSLSDSRWVWPLQLLCGLWDKKTRDVGEDHTTVHLQPWGTTYNAHTSIAQV